MSYCSYCGKKLEDGQKCTCPGAASEQKKTTGAKNIKKIAIPAAIALVLIITVICVVSYIKTGVDLADYIQIDGVTGLNGQGELQYSLDEEELYLLLMGEDKSDDVTEENFEEYLYSSIEKSEMAADAISCILLEPSKETGLSNGDTVTLTATFYNHDNKTFEYHFKDASITYTVEGLAEGKIVDPFADDAVSIKFSGFAGEGDAEFTISATDEIYQHLSYTLKPSSALSNGDTVTLTVDYSESELETLGYFAPGQTEKAYTVAGLHEYFKLSDGLPEDLLDSLCKKALTYTQAEHDELINEYGYSSVTDPEVVSAYFLEVEDPTFPKWDVMNDIVFRNAVMIMTHHYLEREVLSIHMESDYWRTYIFPNFSIDAAGNVSFEEESVGSFLYSYTGSEEATLAAQEQEYYDTLFTRIDLD